MDILDAEDIVDKCGLIGSNRRKEYSREDAKDGQRYMRYTQFAASTLATASTIYRT